MSSYYQILCVNGHSFHRDVVDTSVDTLIKLHNLLCPMCDSAIAWYNEVQDSEGYVSLVLKEKTVSGICPTCKRVGIIKQPTYYIPNDVGVHLGREE